MSLDKNEKISVVVPIYNVEEYLRICIDSIINQTYRTIEIILVDDGSPDNAGAICDDYALRDSRIRVFHISNGGVAKARQLGVESSTSEYIVFVDPDDWLPLNSIEVLYSNMSEEVDIVRSSFNYFNEYNDSYERNELSDNTLYTRDEYLKGVLNHTFVHAPWSSIYRKCLFSQESFPNTKRVQDLLMNLDLACKVRRVKSISNITYNYRNNSQVSSKLNFNNDSDFLLQVCTIMYDILNRNNCYETTKKEYAKRALSLIHTDKYTRESFVVSEIVPILDKQKLNLKMGIKLLALKSSFIAEVVGLKRWFDNY